MCIISSISLSIAHDVMITQLTPKYRHLSLMKGRWANDCARVSLSPCLNLVVVPAKRHPAREEQGGRKQTERGAEKGPRGRFVPFGVGRGESRARSRGNAYNESVKIAFVLCFTAYGTIHL